jgi:hypothetical protein
MSGRDVAGGVSARGRDAGWANAASQIDNTMRIARNAFIGSTFLMSARISTHAQNSLSKADYLCVDADQCDPDHTPAAQSRLPADG